jgi:hypothetical protein
MLSGLVANFAAWKTMAETKARLPENQKFSWWWTWNKHVRLWKEHKRLCPESHWRLYTILSFVVGIVFMILIIVSA